MKKQHRGEGARKAARRKFRHAFQAKQIEKLRELRLSPAATRFHARVAVDVILASKSNGPSRGLMRK